MSRPGAREITGWPDRDGVDTPQGHLVRFSHRLPPRGINRHQGPDHAPSFPPRSGHHRDRRRARLPGRRHDLRPLQARRDRGGRQGRRRARRRGRPRHEARPRARRRRRRHGRRRGHRRGRLRRGGGMSASTKHLIRHYAEMVAAMFAGMAVLGVPFGWGLGAVGSSWTQLTDTAPALMFLAMATTMTVPMVGWMTYRGHDRRANAEMSAAMFV